MYHWTDRVWQVKHGPWGIATVDFLRLHTERRDMAVTGLYGCTSVVAISRTGVHISHFWEEPSFSYGAEAFQSQVMKPLKDGNGAVQMFGLTFYAQEVLHLQPQ